MKTGTCLVSCRAYRFHEHEHEYERWNEDEKLGKYDAFGGVLYLKFILSSAWKKCCKVLWNKEVTDWLVKGKPAYNKD